MPQLTQQQQMTVRAILLVLSGGATAVGILPKVWADWLSSETTITVLCAALALGVYIAGWIKTRPTKVVADAGKIVAKDGGVIIASRAMAEDKATPNNVVSSVSEAAALPGVPK
jgi:hypothetical protein